MNNQELVEKTFTKPFNEESYLDFLVELLNTSNIGYEGTIEDIGKGFDSYIDEVYDYGTFTDDKYEDLKLYVIKLKENKSPERARTMQRNLVGKLLKDESISNALVAFYSDESSDWRFSYINIKYDMDEKGKIKSTLSPAKRQSYYVGPNQSNHTCQSKFNDLLYYDEIIIEQIKEAFKVENVTDEFFKEYKELFHTLADAIQNIIDTDETVKEEFETKEIKSVDFAKKILGQIIFVYFIQKKGWLGVKEGQKWGEGSKNFIKELYNKQYIEYDNFFNDVLEPLFYVGFSTSIDDNHYSEFNCKIPFINDRIFENIKDYNWRKTNINIPNEIFEEIIDTFNTYNFTVKEDEPLEREVAIDPEMLGKVFESLLEVDERKKKGAFYTPRHIVHQICQETLISYLHENTEDIPRDDITKFIKEGHLAIDTIIKVQEEKLSDQEASKQIPIPNTILANLDIIDDLLANVKVVDPAVGSGAFPVGMLNEIVQARSIIQMRCGVNDINYYDLKHETIENSLYGVDISYSAVDIAKLRFWLSLIVDEESIEDIKPLPNLDNKIMCGNSVIDTFEGIELFDKTLVESENKAQTIFFDKKSEIIFRELNNKKKSYFNESSTSTKKQLKHEIQDKKWQFIEQTIKENTNYKNKEEILNKINKFKYAESKPFFIWELEFSEVFQGKNPGFDIVIGNPPYVRHEKIKELKPALKEIYETYTGVADLYVYFFEKGIKLLKENGCLSYITSNKYTRANYGKKLREYILKYYIELYIDYTKNSVFKEAAVDTSIIQLINKNENNTQLYVDNSFYMDQNNLNNDTFSFIKPKIFNVKEKILNQGVKLSNFKGVEIKSGIMTGYNKAFIIDEETKNNLIKKDPKNKNIIKPVLKGKDISKWEILFENSYLVCTANGINVEKEYPTIYTYLNQYVDDLRKRYDKGDKWYNLRTCKYYSDFEEGKLIWPDISGKFGLFAVYDENNFYIDNSCLMLNHDDKNVLKILGALFSSKVLNFVFKIMGGMLGSKGLRLKKLYVKNLPIKFPDDEFADRLVELVDRLQYETTNLNNLTEDKQEVKKVLISKLEDELNDIIYKLYNLNSDDIEIIENFLNS